VTRGAGVVIGAAVIVVAATACAVPPAAEPRAPSPGSVPFEVHLTLADDGTSRQVLLGGKVVLDLPQGIDWEYDEPEDYPDQELATYCTPPAGAVHEVFEAVRTGSTTLAYWRAGGPDRFDVEVEIVDGPGSAPPSSELAGAALRAADEGTTVHVPRNGRVLVELEGQHGLGRDWVVAAGGEELVQYCQPERYPDIGTQAWPGPDDATWVTRFRMTGLAEGSTELVVEYRDAANPDAAPLDTFQATVIVDPAPTPGQPSATPSGAAAAPVELALSEQDAGGRFAVVAGGKVLVTLPDPDGADAAWYLEDSGSLEGQLDWSGCSAVAAGGEVETVALYVGDVLGTAPLVMTYANELEEASNPRRTFRATVTIVDGPGALTPTAKLPLVTLTEQDAGRTVTVPRNSSVSIHLPGQHGLGRDWTLVTAGDGLRAYCPPWLFSEGPGPEDMIVFNVVPFVAMDPGPARLLLEYRDARTPDSDPLDTFEATVVVE
jgi:hypothetical protein